MGNILIFVGHIVSETTIHSALQKQPEITDKQICLCLNKTLFIKTDQIFQSWPDLACR